MSHPLGPKGPFPSDLVFVESLEVLSRTETPSSRQNLADRSHSARWARTEMQKNMAKMCVYRALTHAVPCAVDRLCKPGDPVLVWRDKQINHHIA